ncbi:MAG: ATP12 family chaperone protein [Hyphomonadaceae bacterium]
MSEAARRFYKEAAVREEGGGFAVALDGRALRTPGKLAFAVPTRALADLVAEEWNAQSERIDPMSMPHTRLANVAIERTPATRSDLVAMTAKYGETDLLCHRADAPAALVARQAEAWDRWIAWSRAELQFTPAVVTGIAAQTNDLSPLERAAGELDDFRLTALAHGVGLLGSAILGFALVRGALEADAAFEAAHLDDLHQIEAWGADEEAVQRLDRLKSEIAALAQFIAALG